MYTKDNRSKRDLNNRKDVLVKIPFYRIYMMSDDEWNRLAYKNYLERQANAHART